MVFMRAFSAFLEKNFGLSFTTSIHHTQITKWFSISLSHWRSQCCRKMGLVCLASGSGAGKTTIDLSFYELCSTRFTEYARDMD